MRKLANILCGLCLLVALLWAALPDHASHGAHEDHAQTSAVDQDALCSDGSGHASCQLVATATLSFFEVAPSAKSAQFVITPVSASSRAFAPRRPPPRTFF